jgi:simple sugar transport system ATP-binding protein
MSETLLQARGIVKSYGHVQALRGAHFDVRRDEVVALVGDNGAGKSTLIKILSGILHPDAGEVLHEGQEVRLSTPLAARARGIETVYQDLALAPELDPAANLFLGREILRGGLLGRLGVLDKRAMRSRTQKALASLGLGLQNVDVHVAALSGGQRQGVAVGRAVTWASEIIFMDEPTAALGVVQAKRVLELIRRVREAGISVVLISHNMPQVLEVSDRIEVLRLGRRVARFRTADVKMEDVVGAITGAVSTEEDAE